jgi:hypothetical protein
MESAKEAAWDGTRPACHEPLLGWHASPLATPPGGVNSRTRTPQFAIANSQLGRTRSDERPGMVRVLLARRPAASSSYTSGA